MQIPIEVFLQLLPRATSWAVEQERHVLKEGNPLSAGQAAIAQQAGVRNPNRVRLLSVPRIPIPPEADLQTAAAAIGLITPETAGLTIGHGIFVREDCWGQTRLIGHELVHVSQYEKLGGIEAFLREYLEQCNIHTYEGAPMEQEAIAFEQQVNST